MGKVLIYLVALGFSMGAKGASREEALKPRVDAVWEAFSNTPAEYQEKNRVRVSEYMTLFTTSNDVVWNGEWVRFEKEMGAELWTFRHEIVEAMVVAETYQACYPNPEGKIPAIAEVLFAEIPTNAMVFVHHDYFTSILEIAQRHHGKRPDVRIFNSARLADRIYFSRVTQHYPDTKNMDAIKISNSGFSNAMHRARQKTSGYEGFSEEVKGKIDVAGYNGIAAVSYEIIKEMAKTFPERPVLIMPAVREFWTPVPIWNQLRPNGLFCPISGGSEISVDAKRTVEAWVRLINVATPNGEPAQVRAKNSISRCLNASAFTLVAQGHQDSSSRLIQYWKSRFTSVETIQGERIRINVKGEMILREEKPHP